MLAWGPKVIYMSGVILAHMSLPTGTFVYTVQEQHTVVLRCNLHAGVSIDLR